MTRWIPPLLIALVMEFSVPLSLLAQERDYFIYPRHLPFEAYTSSVGLGLAELPEDQVEEASSFVRAPLLNYQALYGLPENFQIYGAIHTNIVTYQVSLGPRWHYQWEQFAIALGYDIANWFGKLEHFGYDSRVKGWFHYPNITVGYDFQKFSISIKSELILQTALSEQAEDTEVQTSQNTFSGAIISVYLEQPLWKSNYLLLGIKMNYTKFYYPLWAVFPTFDRYFAVPELMIGFNL